MGDDEGIGLFSMDDSMSVEEPAAKKKSNEECAVKVVCRFRPMNDKEKKDGSENPFLVTPESVRDLSKNFYYSRFDAVLDNEANQFEVFKAAASTLVDDVFEGFNTGMFAYGQSGGGKSFSLLGKEGCLMDPEMRGIIPRVISELYERCGYGMDEHGTEDDDIAASDESVVIMIQFFELYLGDIYDLLLPDNCYQPNPSGTGVACCEKLQGREDRHMAKLTTIEAPSAEEAVKLLEVGTARRRYAWMPLNPVSSRSHALFKIRLKRTFKDRTCVNSDLYFADLMGSEAMVEGHGDKITETAAVNNDLLVLGRIITALGQKHGGATSYRDSTLTWVMRDVLGGNIKATVLVTCSPHQMQYHATQNTLKFGDKCKGITRKVQSNRKRLTAAELEAIVQRMQRELDRRAGIIRELEGKLMHFVASDAVANASEGMLGEMGMVAGFIPQDGGGGSMMMSSGGGGGDMMVPMTPRKQAHSAQVEKELEELQDKIEKEREEFKKELGDLQQRRKEEIKALAGKASKAAAREAAVQEKFIALEEQLELAEEERNQWTEKLKEEQAKTLQETLKLEEAMAEKTQALEKLWTLEKKVSAAELGARTHGEEAERFKSMFQATEGEVLSLKRLVKLETGDKERLETALEKAEQVQAILVAGASEKVLEAQQKLQNAETEAEQLEAQALLDEAMKGTKAADEAAAERLQVAEENVRTRESELSEATASLTETRTKLEELEESLKAQGKDHEKAMKKAIREAEKRGKKEAQNVAVLVGKAMAEAETALAQTPKGIDEETLQEIAHLQGSLSAQNTPCATPVSEDRGSSAKKSRAEEEHSLRLIQQAEEEKERAVNRLKAAEEKAKMWKEWYQELCHEKEAEAEGHEATKLLLSDNEERARTAEEELKVSQEELSRLQLQTTELEALVEEKEQRRVKLDGIAAKLLSKLDEQSAIARQQALDDQSKREQLLDQMNRLQQNYDAAVTDAQRAEDDLFEKEAELTRVEEELAGIYKAQAERDARHAQLASLGESEGQIELDLVKQDMERFKQEAETLRPVKEENERLAKEVDFVQQMRDAKEHELLIQSQIFAKESEASNQARRDAETLAAEKDKTIKSMNDEIARLTSVEFIENVGKEFSGLNSLAKRAPRSSDGRSRSSTTVEVYRPSNTDSMFSSMFGSRSPEGASLPFGLENSTPRGLDAKIEAAGEGTLAEALEGDHDVLDRL